MAITIRWNWLLDQITKIHGRKVLGIAYIPFVIIVRKDTPKYVIRHEMIHQRQMLECLIVFWYLIYIGHYLYNRFIKGWKHFGAYEGIVFEKEAKCNHSAITYLKTRKLYAWTKYI